MVLAAATTILPIVEIVQIVQDVKLYLLIVTNVHLVMVVQEFTTITIQVVVSVEEDKDYLFLEPVHLKKLLDKNNLIMCYLIVVLFIIINIYDILRFIDILKCFQNNLHF